MTETPTPPLALYLFVGPPDKRPFAPPADFAPDVPAERKLLFFPGCDVFYLQKTLELAENSGDIFVRVDCETAGAETPVMPLPALVAALLPFASVNWDVRGEHPAFSPLFRLVSKPG